MKVLQSFKDSLTSESFLLWLHKSPIESSSLEHVEVPRLQIQDGGTIAKAKRLRNERISLFLKVHCYVIQMLEIRVGSLVVASSISDE